MGVKTNWSEQVVTPTTTWNNPTTLPVNSTWTEQVITPSTIWAEVLEQFSLWQDGNVFWEDVNSNYEDL